MQHISAAAAAPFLAAAVLLLVLLLPFCHGPCLSVPLVYLQMPVWAGWVSLNSYPFDQ
jgi:hypothetical protein